MDGTKQRTHLFSFKNIVECYVLNGLREIHGVNVRNIKPAVSYLKRDFPSRHPLADHELKTDGARVFFQVDGAYFDVSNHAYEWHDDSNNYFRSYGNENWEFDENGLTRLRFACVNDLPIKESEMKYHWPLGRRPDSHPGLSELGL